MIGLQEQTDCYKRRDEVIEIIVLAMVISKETHAASITLHLNGLTCKDISAKNIAPERIIYQ